MVCGSVGEYNKKFLICLIGRLHFTSTDWGRSFLSCVCGWERGFFDDRSRSEPSFVVSSSDTCRRNPWPWRPELDVGGKVLGITARGELSIPLCLKINDDNNCREYTSPACTSGRYQLEGQSRMNWDCGNELMFSGCVAAIVDDMTS